MLIVAWGIWEFAAPDLAKAESFAVGWMAQIWIRNILLVAVIAGALHWWLWMRMAQQDLRYDSRPMARTSASSSSTIRRRTTSLTLVSAMLIGTLWESVGWWAYANDIAPMITWGDNPIWFVLLFLIVPVWSIAYFSVTHWLLTVAPSTPTCTRGTQERQRRAVVRLAMHPLEHVVLYADVLLFLVLPAHPVHFLFAMMHHSLARP